MNAILSVPLELRLLALAALGALVGAAVNLAVALLTQPRPVVHPWIAPAAGNFLKRLGARLPAVGWLILRQRGDAVARRPGFRPPLVEILAAAGFAWLYWWEIDQMALLPPQFRGVVPAVWMLAAHQQYFAHLILGVLMLAASLIDMDEKIIPDAITLPGTILGLVLAAALPHALLPEVVLPANGMPVFDNLQAASPEPWPMALAGSPEGLGLACGLACFLAWCVALLPRTWYSRHGWRRAMQLCCARLMRDRATRWILLLALVGMPAIYAAWRLGGEPWRGLFCSLLGMAVSGGLVWAVRVIGFVTLRREAMGFGDVTLMFMIGTFLGWQPCLMVFFVAPLPALLVGILQLLAHRENEIPYGPFLCLGALVVIIHWAPLWEDAAGIFAMGAFVPVILAACLVLMAILLLGMRLLRAMF